MDSKRRVSQVNVITLTVGFLILTAVSYYNMTVIGIQSVNVIAFIISLVMTLYSLVRAKKLSSDFE